MTIMTQCRCNRCKGNKEFDLMCKFRDNILLPIKPIYLNKCRTVDRICGVFEAIMNGDMDTMTDIKMRLNHILAEEEIDEFDDEEEEQEEEEEEEEDEEDDDSEEEEEEEDEEAEEDNFD